MKKLLYFLLVLLFLLHNDFWYWHDATIIWGMPIGFLYHAIYCFVVAGAMYLLIKYAWPSHLEAESEKGGKK